MKRPSEKYRAAVTQALTGRTAARTALAHGLPKEAIRSVLNGHDPRLSRADDVCRALGITFLLGGALDEDAGGGDDRKSGPEPELDRELVRDMRLAELVSRLANQWETIPVRERAGIALAIASILDLVGAKGGVSLNRVVEDLGWRALENRMQHESDSQSEVDSPHESDSQGET